MVEHDRSVLFEYDTNFEPEPVPITHPGMTLVYLEQYPLVHYAVFSTMTSYLNILQTLRISREGFGALCSKIKERIGDSTFSSYGCLEEHNGPIVSGFSISG
eukprot:scaffold1988_cov121-Cylindrotheca_fusiformis.AAC.2